MPNSAGAGLVLFLAGSLTLVPGCAISGLHGVNAEVNSLNGNIYVTADTGVPRELSAVNGAIALENGVETGSLSNVNGTVRIAENARVQGDVSNVNGKVVDHGGRINGNINTVNGNIELTGSTVAGEVKSTNGRMTLENASVKRLTTMNGSATLKNTLVEGPVHVQKSSWPLDVVSLFRVPSIDIGENSEIRGDIIVDRRIKLYVHETAKIDNVFGADIIRYSGSRH